MSKVSVLAYKVLRDVSEECMQSAVVWYMQK